MKVRDHEPSPQGPWCRHCGAYSINGIFRSDATRNEREVGHEILRPEPARREVACEDGGTISARIAELAAQRTEAMNHVEPEPSQAPEPDYDYGCG